MKKNLLLFLITLSANLLAVEYTVNWQKQFSEGNYYRYGKHLYYAQIDERGIIYLTIDGKVNALSSVDGSIIWTNHEVNATSQWYNGGTSGPHYSSYSQPLALGNDNCLYTISVEFTPVDEYPFTQIFATYLVAINKFDGSIINRLLISTLIPHNGYDTVSSIVVHNNHILINEKIYISFLNGKFKYIRNIGSSDFWSSSRFLGFTDNLAIFYSEGHLFAEDRVSGQVEWTNHIFKGHIYGGHIDEVGNLYFISGNLLYSVDSQSGKINYTTQISMNSSFLNLDSIINGEETRGGTQTSIIGFSSENIFLQTKNTAGDSYKSFVLKINKITGNLLAKKSAEYDIYRYHEIDDTIETISHGGGIRFYQNSDNLDSNHSAYIDLGGTYLTNGKNIFIVNDTNITSLTVPNLLIDNNHHSFYAFTSSNYTFPDTSIKYEANSSNTVENNESIFFSVHTPQNTDSSNSGSSSGGTDTSNGGSSDYSSDPNYIADFIATNALDYGYAPLVELTSTGATPHTNGWYYQPTWGWMWTSESIFPYVYRSDTEGKTAGWMYFKEGSGSPIYFYSYEDQKWTLLKESTD